VVEGFKDGPEAVSANRKSDLAKVLMLVSGEGSIEKEFNTRTGDWLTTEESVSGCTVLEWVIRIEGERDMLADDVKHAGLRSEEEVSRYEDDELKTDEYLQKTNGESAPCAEAAATSILGPTPGQSYDSRY
jgi:hypothetical protein